MRTLSPLLIVLLLGACVEPNAGKPKQESDATPAGLENDATPTMISSLDGGADAPVADAPALPSDGPKAPVDLAPDTTPDPTSCAGPSSQACGKCGTQTRTCAGGQWSAWSACAGEGACAPGTSQNCGSGGMQSCGGDCKWGACGNQTCPGASSQPCGKCGTQTRTCDNATGTWSAWSACAGEGVCTPNTNAGCGSAGGSHTCRGDCTWGACSCVGATTQSCNCTGTQTRTCLDGTWSGWSGCVGGTNTNSDAQNCGGCGRTCVSGSCVGGLCACGTCGACQKCDTSTGACVANTGAACPVTNGGGACDASGSCKVTSCNTGYANCGGICTAESDRTCGQACNDCYAPPNNPTPHIDFASCINHACKITQCNSEGPFCAGCPKIADWGDCNNSWADGCEIDLTTNPNNCAECGNKCSTCTAGSALSWCQFCATPPCGICRKHPGAGGPKISCDTSN